MLRRKRNLIAAVVLVLIIIAAWTANFWVIHAPSAMNPDERLISPNAGHWFGTDNFGRDIFSRTIVAAKISLIVGITVTFFATVLGTITGLWSGYYKKADFIIMRIIDGFLAFPALLLALALVAALGGNLFNIILALTISFFPAMARIVRASALQIKSISYVEAAKTSGVNDIIILYKYILPNILSPIIVQATFIFANAILAEAALSFLGVGIDPSIPTWGNMLKEAQIYITIAPWFSIFPGLLLVITVLALNFLGDGIRNSLNPHTKHVIRAKSTKPLLKWSKSVSWKGAHQDASSS